MSRVVVLLLPVFLSTCVAQARPRPPATPRSTAGKPAAPAKQLLLDVASGKQPLADLIDPSVGLLFMDHFEGPGEDGNTIEDLHVCPRDLATFSRARWASVAEAIRSGQQTHHLTCTAGPRPTCQAGGAGEWDPVLHFTFGTRGGDRQLVLRAIAIDDEVLADPDHLVIEHAGQANLLAHLASCP